MKRLALPNTGFSVSTLCLGGSQFGAALTEPETFALLDRFAELGGNFIDTARVYSDWVPGESRRSERVLGDWVRRHGDRDGLVLATKGGHPFLDSPEIPRTSADELRDDVEGSLRALRCDVIDLYWLHRDDLSRPVEHFIDVLNGFLREGKIRTFGASNWTAPRLRAANDYARGSGQHGFVASQPFWSLGCQQTRHPLFPGCVPFDAELSRFHRETGLSVIPYSSQAHGFFSKFARLAPERRRELSDHVFHTAPNLVAARLVIELAAAKQVTPTAIVLSYLWSRPFPVAPIVGSRTSAQLEDSVAALGVRLAPDELRQLEIASQSGL